MTAWHRANSAEVAAVYERDRRYFASRPEERRSRHIFVAFPWDPTDADRIAARARAQELLDRLRAGEDFAALARAHSDISSADSDGGEIGWTPRGQLGAPYEAALWSLSPGETHSTWVETQFGLHIIRCEGVRGPGELPRADAEAEIAARLADEALSCARVQQAAADAVRFLEDGHDAAELDTRMADGPMQTSEPFGPGERAFEIDRRGTVSNAAFQSGQGRRFTSVDRGACSWAVIERLPREAPPADADGCGGTPILEDEEIRPDVFGLDPSVMDALRRQLDAQERGDEP